MVDERVIVGEGATSPLGGVVGFIMHLEVVYLVIVAHVQPIHGGKDMLPPFVPILRGSGRVESLRPRRGAIVLHMAQCEDGPNAGGLQRAKDGARIALPHEVFVQTCED